MTIADVSGVIPSAAPSGRWRLNDLSGRDWVQRTKSIIFQRGLGLNHPETKYERLHPCPFSYQDAEQFITFFTKQGERVLDPFAGVSSTLKACALSGRLGTGVELNPQFCAWSHERLDAEVPREQRERYPQDLIMGDARTAVEGFEDDTFQFALSSPPYWTILGKRPDAKARTSSALRDGTLAYSDDPRDFGCIADYDDFIGAMADFVCTWRRILQPRRYLALIVADFRDGPVLYPYHADLIAAIRARSVSGDRELVLQGISILAQNQKRLYAYGYPTTYVPNIHHHYALIYRNLPRDQSGELQAGADSAL